MTFLGIYPYILYLFEKFLIRGQELPKIRRKILITPN
jgi:hypothetical protein